MSRRSLVGYLVALAGILASSSFEGQAQAVEIASTARARTVPTLESLPHVALPRGVFKGWCGQKDRYLLDVDGQIEAYDAGVKYAVIAVSSDWPWQCSNDGEQLVYINTHVGYVTRIDISSGDSLLLASYQRPERESTTISFSPDLGSVATTIPLKLTADAGKLKVVLVRHYQPQGPRENIQWIRWSKDASRVAVAYESARIEILESDGRRVSLGTKPKSWNVDDGWFDADRKMLTLFLVPEQERTGIAVKCDLGSWKCSRIKSRVDSFSIGGRGIVGAVEPLGKTPPRDDDSIMYHRHYAAEVRHQPSGLLARQIYDTVGGRLEYAMSISPSGTKAILTWRNRQLAGCETGSNPANCAQGILIDLAKASR
jgi:hypothetical protein